MPFDKQKFHATATHAELAGVALSVSMGFFSIRRALAAIRDGEKIDKHLDEIDRHISELDKTFDELTGYKPDVS